MTIICLLNYKLECLVIFVWKSINRIKLINISKGVTSFHNDKYV